jgi:phosphosulfolactate synthase
MLESEKDGTRLVVAETIEVLTRVPDIDGRRPRNAKHTDSMPGVVADAGSRCGTATEGPADSDVDGEDISVLEIGYAGRIAKPRVSGLTAVIDRGLAFRTFSDIIQSHHAHIDFVKFGWGTAIVTATINEKIALLKDFGIGFWFGGTLFEIAYSQGRLNKYINWAKNMKTHHFEVSDGTIALTAAEKTGIIRELKDDFCVLLEVGQKDTAAPVASRWIEQMQEGIEAGARWIITEGRESGTAGLFSDRGDVREDLIFEILRAGVGIGTILFEAPKMAQQVWFISRLGSDVNLSNIQMDDVISLETLRCGLRSDTAHLAVDTPKALDRNVLSSIIAPRQING